MVQYFKKYLSIDKIVIGERDDFIESGEKSLNVLTEIVAFVILQDGSSVKLSWLDHQLE